MTYYKASDLAGLTVGLKNKLFVPDKDTVTGAIKGYTLKEPYTSIELVIVGDEQVYFLKGDTQDDKSEKWLLTNDTKSLSYKVSKSSLESRGQDYHWAKLISNWKKYCV